MLQRFVLLTSATVCLLSGIACTDAYSALDLDIDIPNFYQDVGGETTLDSAAPPEEVQQDLGPQCLTDQDCQQFYTELTVCQVALCDSAAGMCVKGNLKNWLPCDDQDQCTNGTICHDGACTGGTQMVCDDLNPCTDDGCDSAQGGCVFTDNDQPCDDGNGCTKDDVCKEGQCLGSPSADCWCETDKDCTSLEDTNLCNGTLVCWNEECTVDPATIIHCDSSLDGPCEETFCAPNLGQCVTTALDDGTPCNDGISCTISDKCADGVCSGAPVPCECQADEDCGQFDDDNLCNGTLICVEQLCVTDPDSTVVCNAEDNTACSKRICDPGSGQCQEAWLEDGSACSDEDPCTVPDLCAAGECTAGSFVCGAVCGNAECEQSDGENCITCVDDCGLCPAAPCCEPHEFPGCDNKEVEVCVCEQDPYCCEISWDQVCVNEVDESQCGYCIEPICGDGACSPFEDCKLCPKDCGQCPPGPCCQAKASPGCPDADVEECVCAIDPYCCDVVWDTICADEVEEYQCGWCGVGPWCGNLECEAPPEDCNTCPGDCGECQGCNSNGECENWLGEYCDNCPQDCGPCPAAPCCEPHDFPGCDEPEINDCVCLEDPFCCEVMWDGICVSQVNNLGCGFCEIPPCGNDICESGLEDCINCPEDCGPCPVGDCCKPHDFPGCEDPFVMLCVCSNDLYCCDIEWDELCVQSVNEFDCGTCDLPAVCEDGQCEEPEDCQTCPEDCGPCPPVCGDEECWQGDENCNSCPQDCGDCVGECCEVNLTPGCEDPGITACVCETDFYCCDSSWDIMCVKEVEQYGCGECAEPVVCSNGLCDGEEDCESCPEDCGPCPPFCGDQVCTPFEDCLTCPADCGPCPPECGDGNCDGEPFDEDCGSCPEDCGICPGSCCEKGEGPGCQETGCQDLVCQFDSFCCSFQWEALCVLLAHDMCGECGGQYPGQCCQPHLTPGCNDQEIMDCVCAQDPVCCDEQWDDICAAQVVEFGCDSCGLEPLCGDHICEGGENCYLCPADCGPCTGDCCVPQDGPGCQDLEVMMCVCDFNPSCCLDLWNQGCTDQVEKLNCGSCTPVPFCGDLICLDDENCQTCPEDCGECAGPCCEPHLAPMCDQPDVAECVCSQAPHCCSLGWDETCVKLVEEGDCGICPGGEGDCCQANDTPGCQDIECEAQVCEINIFCCGVVWDQLCATTAAMLCPACGLQPECGDQQCTPDEDCDTCPEDCGPCPPECGDGNCDGDLWGENCDTCPEDCGKCPYCGDHKCDPDLDEDCKSCPLDCGPCPEKETCCEAHSSPGCDDPDVEQCVCALAPSCCQQAWDPSCPMIAQAVCNACVGSVCGDEVCDPAESCLTCPQDCGPCQLEPCCQAHNSPGCADPDIMQCVCIAHPACCQQAWTDQCVTEIKMFGCGECP